MPRTAASEIHAKVVGREIRATRNALGLTQSEVAERLGASASYISAVEAGRRNLTLGQLANIANAMRLGVNVSSSAPTESPLSTSPPASRLDRRAASPVSLARPRRVLLSWERGASARSWAGLPVFVPSDTLQRAFRDARIRSESGSGVP
jgi:transcriptional regulator with XRE-family HTH domain